MAKLGALMGLGRGLTAAGQGIDQAFQYKMELMRQQSLKELEERRLGLAESELGLQKEYYTSQTQSALRGDQMRLMERFSEEMDELLAEAPDQQLLNMLQKSMEQVTKELAVSGMSDPQTIKEAVTGVFAQAAVAKDLYAGTAEEAEAKKAWLNKAERLVKRSHSQWQKLFGKDDPMTLADFAVALSAPEGLAFEGQPLMGTERKTTAFDGAVTGRPTMVEKLLAEQETTAPSERTGYLEGGINALPSSPLGIILAAPEMAPGLMSSLRARTPDRSELPGLMQQGMRGNPMTAPFADSGLFGLPQNQMPVQGPGGPLDPDDPLNQAVDR